MVLHKHALESLSKQECNGILREHRQLTKYISELKNACHCAKEIQQTQLRKCNSEDKASCAGRFPSYLYHVIELASRHFVHEEMIMLEQAHINEDNLQFIKHHQAHVKIMTRLHKMIDDYFSEINDVEISALYQRFYTDINSLFDAHDKAFDNPFLNKT
jgi:hypothetical protein